MKIPMIKAKIPPVGYSLTKPPPEKRAAVDVRRIALEDKRREYYRLQNKLNLFTETVGVAAETIGTIYKYQYNEQYNKAKAKAMKRVGDFLTSLQGDYDYETWVPRFEKEYEKAKKEILSEIKNPDAQKDFQEWFDMYAYGKKLDVIKGAFEGTRKRTISVLEDTLVEYASNATERTLPETEAAIKQLIQWGVDEGLYDFVTAKKYEEQYIHMAHVQYFENMLGNRVNQVLDGITFTEVSQYDTVKEKIISIAYEIATDEDLGLKITNKEVEEAVKKYEGVIDRQKAAFIQRQKDADMKAYQQALDDVRLGKLTTYSAFIAGTYGEGPYVGISNEHRKIIGDMINALQKAQKKETLIDKVNDEFEKDFLYKWYTKNIPTQEQGMLILTDALNAEIIGTKQFNRLVNVIKEKPTGLWELMNIYRGAAIDAGMSYRALSHAMRESYRVITDPNLTESEKTNRLMNIWSEEEIGKLNRKFTLFKGKRANEALDELYHLYQSGKFVGNESEVVYHINEIGSLRTDEILKELNRGKLKTEVIRELETPDGYKFYDLKVTSKDGWKYRFQYSYAVDLTQPIDKKTGEGVYKEKYLFIASYDEPEIGHIIPKEVVVFNSKEDFINFVKDVMKSLYVIPDSDKDDSIPDDAPISEKTFDGVKAIRIIGNFVVEKGEQAWNFLEKNVGAPTMRVFKKLWGKIKRK